MMEVGEYDNLVDDNRRQRSFFVRFKFPIIALLVFLAVIAIALAVVFTTRGGEDKPWEEQISVDKIMGHLQQLQKIADDNNGNRAAGTSGYNASVQYVLSQLKDNTNYEVSVQYFTYNSSTILGQPSNLSVWDPTKPTYDLPYAVDGFIIAASNGGDININNATVVHVANDGCHPSDYAAVQPDQVALSVRTTCSFGDRLAAAAAGCSAAGMILYYPQDSRLPLNLIPEVKYFSNLVLTTNFEHGSILAGTSVTISAKAQANVVPTMNIIADTKEGNASAVVLIGSHLDSVPMGPGINDNGSGSALNLALALELASGDKLKRIKSKVRFCWWGAEELGLLGSEFYVSNLNSTNITALREIAVNLNFDMIGSPNFVRGVYNGSNDTHVGSHVVEHLFNEYYASQNLPVMETPFNGRSDYGPFLAVGIPAGGLATGAEEIKTMAERSIFGGLADTALDPCYHKACDTIENINQGVVGDMARGAAHVMQKLSTADNLVNYLLTPPTK